MTKKNINNHKTSQQVIKNNNKGNAKTTNRETNKKSQPKKHQEPQTKLTKTKLNTKQSLEAKDQDLKTEKQSHIEESSKLSKILLVSRSLFILFFVISLILATNIIKLKILPIKYLLILGILYLVITIVLGFLAIKKQINQIVKILVSLFLVLFTLICLFTNYYLKQTKSFINNIQSENYQLENYYILVLNDSEYTNIEELKNIQVGVYNIGTDIFNEAMSKLNDKVVINPKDYNDIIKLGKDLIRKKIAAIFISESYQGMIEDEITDFSSKVKVLDSVSVKKETAIIKKDVDVKNQAFNIYISGIDVYGDISSISRSDVNMVATINPLTHKVLLTSIPRDYYVPLYNKEGYKDKLTHAGIYGIETSVKTVEELLAVDINYYVRVNFTTLIKLVDAIGGINVNVDFPFRAITGEYFKAGNNYLNGKNALVFSRERHAFRDGDRQRGKNQQKVLTAIIDKTLSSTTLITKYTNILKSLETSFQTNMDSEKIIELVNMQIDKMPTWTIETNNLTGTDSSNYTYSYSAGKLYVMEPDEQSIKEAQVKIDKILEEKNN